MPRYQPSPPETNLGSPHEPRVLQKFKNEEQGLTREDLDAFFSWLVFYYLLLGYFKNCSFSSASFLDPSTPPPLSFPHLACPSPWLVFLFLLSTLLVLIVLPSFSSSFPYRPCCTSLPNLHATHLLAFQARKVSHQVVFYSRGSTASPTSCETRKTENVEEVGKRSHKNVPKSPTRRKRTHLAEKQEISSRQRPRSFSSYPKYKLLWPSALHLWLHH
jgi:hypothetical protein